MKAINEIKRHHFFIVLFLLISILIIYSQSLNYSFVNYDDYQYVVTNSDIRKIDIPSIKNWFSRDYVYLYIPVTIASYAIDYQIWELNPFGYRFNNILLHFLNCILVYFIIFRLTQNRARSLSIALLFAIHPVQIESVAWISERKNLLAAFFLLTSFLFYSSNRIWLALCAYLIGLLSKPSVIVLPMIFISYDYFIRDRIIKNKSRLTFYPVAILMACIISIITVRFQHVGDSSYRGDSFFANLFTMTTVFFRYIKLLIYPFDQQILYVTKIYYAIWNWPVLLSLVVLLLGIVWSVKNHRKQKNICFWISWYVLLMFPVSNIIFPFSTLMNDRYLYLPMIGFFMAVILVADGLLKRLTAGQRGIGWVAVSCVGIFVSIMFFYSHERVKVWKNATTLWDSGIENSKLPDKRYHTGLAAEYFRAGDYEKSIDELKKAMKFFKDERNIILMAQNYLMVKQPQKAHEYLLMLNKDKIVDGSSAEGVFGKYYEEIGDDQEAEKSYLRSLEYERTIPSLINLSQFYERTGQLPKAFSLLQQAMAIDPDSDDALYYNCLHYLNQQQYDKAYPLYVKLLRLYPKHRFVQFISSRLKIEQAK